MAFFNTQLRRLRFWRSLSLAYFKRYRIVFVISIVVLLALTLIISKIWPVLTKTKILAIGYVGVYTLETLPTSVLSLATQPLISVDKSGKPQGALASHWTISDDGKTYIVFLKDNIRWHDGSTVDAKDITIAVRDVQITALNNKAIEFKLPNPIASFLTALDKPVFKTKSFYGTGEFRIVKIDTVNKVVRKISLVPKNKNLPDVDIKFYDNEVQAYNALKIGEIKNCTVASGQDFENWPNLEVVRKIDDSEIVTIFFNTQDVELSSPELRQALNYAINRSDFDGIRALGPISPSSWAFNPQVKRYEYNTGKARELLIKSQVAGPQITLTVTPGLEKVAADIRRDWEALGVKTILTSEKTVPKKFQALLAVNKLSPDPDQYTLWHSSLAETTNITNYKTNKKTDKLLEDGRSLKDENARKEVYFDFQRSIVEDSPAIFLYHPYKYQVTYKNIKERIAKLPIKN